MIDLLEALTLPLFALLDFTLAAPVAATATLTASGVVFAATARFFLW